MLVRGETPFLQSVWPSRSLAQGALAVQQLTENSFLLPTQRIEPTINRLMRTLSNELHLIF